MWLFHFRVAGEKKTGSKSNSHGLGHAMRCLSIIEELKNSLNIDSKIVTSENDEAKSLLKSFDQVYYPESQLQEILEEKSFDVIVSDINYLEDSVIKTYQRFCPWVCLAPRGSAKYQSNLAFRDTLFDDLESSTNNSNSNILTGPSYTVTRKEFGNIRQNLENGNIKKPPKSLVISMGGVDHFDMTKTVLRGLIGLPESWTVNVIEGPLYDHHEGLEMFTKKYFSNLKIVKDPKNIYELLALNSIGIFAAGIVSYEAIGLGTICINISFTEFHKKRSDELEELGIAINLGDIDKIEEGQLSNVIVNLNKKSKQLQKMKLKGMQVVDGKGSTRIINEISRHLDLQV